MWVGGRMSKFLNDFNAHCGAGGTFAKDRRGDVSRHEWRVHRLRTGGLFGSSRGRKSPLEQVNRPRRANVKNKKTGRSIGRVSTVTRDRRHWPEKRFSGQCLNRFCEPDALEKTALSQRR